MRLSHILHYLCRVVYIAFYLLMINICNILAIAVYFALFTSNYLFVNDKYRSNFQILFLV